MNAPLPEPLIHVVDDDAALRKSVVFLVESVGWHACGHAGAQAFLDAVDPGRPGCALLDVRMPGMSGIELQRAMRDAGIDLPVIFLTGHGDVALAVQAMKDGAIDLIEKPFRDQVLLDTVARAVRIGQAAHEAARRRRAIADLVEQLTPREFEVAQLVGLGHPNKTVARRLDISEKTVHIHRSRLLDKLGVRSAAELARLLIAIDPGFGSDPRPGGEPK